MTCLARATARHHARVGMKHYRNLSGHSGVIAYEIGADVIAVKFRDGGAYWYTHASAGPVHVEAMKQLAVAGRGLSTYIARNQPRYDPDGSLTSGRRAGSLP